MPPDLAEILRNAALIEGYDPNKQYLFIYQLLKEHDPERTAHLVAAWKAEWLDQETPD